MILLETLLQDPRFPPLKIENHLSKQAVRPGEPIPTRQLFQQHPLCAQLPAFLSNAPKKQ